MTAQIIDFAEKRKERLLKKIEQMTETEFTQMTGKALENFSMQLRQHIIQNAEETFPCSYDPNKTTVVINGMHYVI